jgi:hypothetical protein
MVGRWGVVGEAVPISFSVCLCASTTSDMLPSYDFGRFAFVDILTHIFSCLDYTHMV